MQRITIIAVILWASSLAAPSSAHFLFVCICPPAEGGRSAEVYFSELAAAGDPRYIDKVASAQFWVQQAPGEFKPLPMHKLSDRLRAHVPIDGSLIVAGQLDYGVLNRPAQPPFLLRHYSKAAAGKPEELNRMQAKGTPLEIVATFESDRVVLGALVDGKPYAGAKFTTVDLDLSNEELTADSQGRVTFRPPGPSVYSVYVAHVRPDGGEHSGANYKEVREFATVAFSWPLVPTKADPEAVKLFEEALTARAVWSEFPGFTAKIAGTIEDRPFEGKVAVAADGGVELAIDEEAMSPWVHEQLESITMHRAAGQTPGADRPKPVLRYADSQVEHPLGRLLAFEGGHFATSYRVKDRQITSVNRVLDGKNMTITVLDNQLNPEGHFLPRAYTVQYWDDSTGKLERTENVQDRWLRMISWDLPAERTVTTSSDGGFSVRRFTLSDHQISSPKAK